MQDLKNKVIVITGAAEGIGRAIAEAALARGMKLVLADIDPARLEKTRAELAAQGAELIAQRVDVAQAEQVEALADAAYAAFGAVHVLVNNAGVALAKTAWETTPADWQWIIGVNLYGVSHGLRAFVPRMLAGGEAGHIVNTASVAGLISEPAMAAYNASKFAVVTLTEGLHHDLALRQARIKASVLCPAWVKTRIADAERNRQDGARQDFSQSDAHTLRTGLAIAQAVQNGMAPEQVAEAMFDAIAAGRFYILPHAQLKAGVQVRLDDILQDRLPTLLPL